MRTIIALVTLLALFSCSKNKNTTKTSGELSAGEKKFEVVEVLQANQYSYLKVKEAGDEHWVAISRQEVSKGDILYYDQALEMNNFHSKDLNRDFEKIYFISNTSKTPVNPNGELIPEGHTGKVENPLTVAPIQKNANELTIAQLYSKKAEFAGKEIVIKGSVVKVVKDVMGKNWIHIQDGTNDNGKFDLTITSSDLPGLNDIITAKGKITLDKDFGYGYFYDVIMEDGVITQKEHKTKVI